MKKILSFLAALSICTLAFADIQLQQNGTNKGIATKLNFTGATVTRNGETGTVAVSGSGSLPSITDTGSGSTPGNVGVSSTTPGATLDVGGTVKATSFVGNGSGLTGINSSADPSFVDCVITAGSDGSICAMSVATTTGGISSSSSSLSVGSATGWVVGEGIMIKGAGAASADLISYVTAISGTTFTLHDAAGTTVSGAVVNHDDTRAINTALASGKSVLMEFGKYPVSSALNIAVGVLFKGAGALNLNDQNTTRGIGTVIIENETTNNWLNVTTGSAFIRDMSFQIASGLSATAGYAFQLGNTSIIANTTFENLSSFGSYGGIKINTHVAVARFNQMYMITVGGSSTEAAIRVNNATPYGDIVFNNITALPMTAGGFGILIDASDVEFYNNLKINGYTNDVFINPSTGNQVFNQIFMGCSLEGSSSPSTHEVLLDTSNGGSVYSINFIGGEIGFGQGLSQWAMLIGTGVKEVTVTGVLFHSFTNGIDVGTNTGGHLNFISNIFDNITTTAMMIPTTSNHVNILGDVASGSVVGGSSALGGLNVIGDKVTANVATGGSNGGGIFQASSNTNSAVVQGERLGSYAFAGARTNVATFESGGAEIKGFADGNWSNTSIPTYLEFDVVPSGSLSESTAMTINSNSNVGIGSTNPGHLLTVDGVTLGTTGTSAYIAGDSALGQQMTIAGHSNNNQQLVMGYSTTGNYAEIQSILQGTIQEPLNLNPGGGNVGIGTNAAPTQKLDVKGTINATSLSVAGAGGVSGTGTTSCLCKTFAGGICTVIGTCS